jgi:hypothetical protein
MCQVDDPQELESLALVVLMEFRIVLPSVEPEPIFPGCRSLLVRLK